MIKFVSFLLVRLQLAQDYLSRKIFGHSVLSMIRVTPNVFLGGAFTQKNIEHVKKWGITAVVSMRMHKPPIGIKTLHLPTIDDTAPKIEDLESGVKFIQDEVNKGGKVYVHCREGIGRGPTMMIAYLITQGMKIDKALKLIREVRRFVNPNKEQLNSLIEFEKRFKAKNNK